MGVGAAVAVRLALVGEQRGVVPAGLAVAAPVDRQRPARQLLARVPLALAEVQEAACAVACAQPVHERGGQAALGRTQGVGIPLRGVAVVDGDEGGLAAHRQPHVTLLQLGVDGVAEVDDVAPLLVAVGQRHARRFVDARHRHVVRELDLAVVDRAADRRRRRRLGRAGHRDVAFTGEQPGSRIQADPAGARQVDLAPGVQVGEIVLGARGAVERLDVGLELDQVAGDEARGQPQVAQRLHEQPAGVATRAAAAAQGELGRLHAGLHADEVGDVLLQALVEADEKVDRSLLLQRNALDEGLEARRALGQRPLGQVGREVVPGLGGVAEGEVLGLGLEEEVEGVEHRHLGDEVDGDLEFACLLGKDQARQVVGERVLLPIDEVLRRLDAQRIAQDARAAMRRRAQPHDLRRERDAPVVAVVRDVVQRDMDGHGVGLLGDGGTDRAGPAARSSHAIGGPRCRGPRMVADQGPAVAAAGPG